jgi:hypothetical protein
MSLEVKQPDPERNRSTPLSGEVKNVWTFTSMHPPVGVAYYNDTYISILLTDLLKFYIFRYY